MPAMALVVVQIILALGYPFIVFFGLRRFEPREVGLGLLALVLVRILGRPSRLLAYVRSFWLPIGGIAGIAALAAVSNHPLVLLLAPTVTSWTLLLVFGRSLSGDLPVIERFARIQAGTLSAEEVRYCRTVTWVWCGFFLVNGVGALALALAGSLAAWAWYTGLLAYVLMGMLFASELTVRHWRFRRYLGAPTDILFRWVFPARQEAVSGRALRPEVLASRVGEELREFELRVPEDLACWPGHFPGFRLVPGVLQVDWVMGFIQEWIGEPPHVERIEGLKFMAPLLPGASARLSLERADAARFHFKLANDAEAFSLGRISVVQPGPQT
jgi:uncharacterized membrane protein/3-hydroxymyristoyl/3-hydroxydecanoyl-(acyl carrier protein) dehydratase